MGNLQALSLSASIDEGLCDLTQALTIHLQSNHYPPLPTSLIPACLEAIKQANAGNWDAIVKLPDGVSWRGKNWAPVGECIEGWHLDAFLDECDD